MPLDVFSYYRLIGNIVECKGGRELEENYGAIRLIGNIVECKDPLLLPHPAPAPEINRKHSGM